MKLNWVCCFFLIILIVDDSQSQEIITELYTELQSEFELQNSNLENILSKYENQLVDSKILKDESGSSRKQILQSISADGDFAPPDLSDSINSDLRSQLSLQSIFVITTKVKRSNSSAFVISSFNKIIQQIESSPLSNRGSPAVIANAILNNLDNEDFEHPFYRALFLMVIANFEDIRYRSSDYILVTEAEYEQFFGTKDHDFSRIESRNIIAVNVDKDGKVKVENNDLSGLSKLQSQIENCYTMNRDLTKNEIVSAISDPTNSRYVRLP